ncbi:MAG: tyrosine-type recombinase/integrase [Bdellovibrionales bacterium]|nr:tyrosine-type recombinase/integrase [Bdellovibrionales bacterium]
MSHLEIPTHLRRVGTTINYSLMRMPGASKFVLPRFQSWKDGRQAEILREFCQGAGIPSVKFHTIRACFATQLIRDGIAPAVVMKVSGWKDLKTMRHYIRLAGIEIRL